MLHFRWDLDKTYIHTEFDSLRDLVRTFRQTASDKRSIAGAPTLLRELLAPAAEDSPRRVTFISGSPRQMRRVLTEKLRLDGIEPDAFVLKPNLSNLLKLRFRALNEQLGYKLSALLKSQIPGADVKEFLFGDDSEADALIYSLYADMLAGRIDRAGLAAALRGSPLYRSDIEDILSRFDALGDDPPEVARIFIHLDRRSPTSRFDSFGARVVPVYNYFQAAVVLYEMEVLSQGAFVRVVEAMGDAGYTPGRLANSLQDIVRRGYVAAETLERGRDSLHRASELMNRPASLFVAEFRDTIGSIEPIERGRPWFGEIDYVAGCAHTSRYRRARTRLQNVGILAREE